ncbi:unnamed protein product, partial [Rotaria magnacalcarata]
NDNDNNKKKKTVDTPTVYDGKSDDKTRETDSNRKPTPRSSPGHVNSDLTNSTNSENLPCANTIVSGDDPNDGLMPQSHMMMNGAQTASMPIPYQRMQNNNQQQQQQQQQQQMLLYPHQQA